MIVVLNKVTKLVKKTVFILILTIFLVLTGFTIYLFTPSGERFLTNQIQNSLNKMLDTRVEIGTISFDLTGKANLSRLTIYDHKDSIVLSSENTEVKFYKYNFALKTLEFSFVNLDQLIFNGVKYEGDESYNFEYIINKLIPEKDESADGIKIIFRQVNLKDSYFQLFNKNEAKKEDFGVDYNYLALKNLNLDAFNFIIDKGILSVDVEKLSTIDHSGFNLQNLKTRFTFSPNYMNFMKLQITTQESSVNGNFKMEYESISDFSDDFINLVNMSLHLQNSHLTASDLAWFSGELPLSQSIPVKLSGDVEGTVSSLRGRGINIEFGQNSALKGNIRFTGLPDIFETLIDLNLDYLTLSPDDLTLLLPELELPEILSNSGITTISGNLTGFPMDFVAFADFKTPFGNFSSDINLKISDDPAKTEYSGHIDLKKFNIGKLIQNEELLGEATLVADLKGKGIDLDNITAILNAKIEEIWLNEYNYKKVDINGEIDKRLFSGKVNINDPNLKLDFNGTIDFNTEEPQFDFEAAVAYADLRELNLMEDSLVFSTELIMDFSGNDINSIDGTLLFKNSKLITSLDEYEFDSLYIVSSLMPFFKKIDFYSDMFTASFDGVFEIENIPALISNVIKNYINPKYIPEYEPSRGEYVNFDIRFMDVEFILRFLTNDLDIANNTFASGTFDGSDGKLILNAYTPYIRYKDIAFSDLSIDADGSNNWLSSMIVSSEFIYKDSLYAKNISLRTLSNTNTINYTLIADGFHDHSNVNLNGDLAFSEESISISVLNSSITLMDSVWLIHVPEMVLYPDSVLSVPMLSLSSGKQTIKIEGDFNKDFDYPVNVIFENIELHDLALFIPADIPDLTGQLNGKAVLSHITDSPVIESDFTITNFAINEEKIGNVELSTTYSRELEHITLDALIVSHEDVKTLDISGYLDFASETDNFNILLSSYEMPLVSIEAFIDEFVSDLEGNFSGELNLKGTFDKPDFTGKIHLHNASLIVNYLQTRYSLTHSIDFDNRQIVIQQLNLTDINGNNAFVNGIIRHENFSNIYLDLSVLARNFHMLNTNQFDNDLFYGVAYASGVASFRGPLEMIAIDIRIKSERNTKLFLPIGASDDYYVHSYIRFTDDSRYFQEDFKLDFTGIELSIDIEITPDAELQIISSGDIISGSGEGNISMKYTSSGEFTIFGDFRIMYGDYNFTVWDVITKKFSIEDGSTISWRGDPYEAFVNITANYRVRTSLDMLLPPEEDRSLYRQKVPVDARLILTGELFSPDIKLNFDISEGFLAVNLPPTLQYSIQRIKNNEQELNRQVVSLLVFNSFAPLYDQSAQETSLLAGTGISTGLSDLVSNHMSSWLSGWTGDLQLGVTYRGFEGVRDERELELAASTSVFNDRVTLSGAYDVENITGNFEVSYKVREDGKVQVKVFTRNDQNPVMKDQSAETSGLGVFYRQEFDSFNEFFKRKNKDKKKKDDSNKSDGKKEDTEHLIDEKEGVVK